MAKGIEKEFQKLELICTEGDPGNFLYILKKGVIGVYKDNQLLATIDKSGTVLGEMSLILGEKRTATLKALEDTTVSVVEVTLPELVQKFPSFTVRTLRILAERLKETTENLSHVMLEHHEDEEKIHLLEDQIEDSGDSIPNNFPHGD